MNNPTFQFQYGAIKRITVTEETKNSYRFQFQYGAIKRRETFKTQAGETIFQFQYGAIKSNSAKNSDGVFGYFNSSMVRLKDCYLKIP